MMKINILLLLLILPHSLFSEPLEKLARGEKVSFYSGKKYVGNIIFNKEYNLLSIEGKVPDSSVNTYSQDGKQDKELNFVDGKLSFIKIFDSKGNIKYQKHYK
ncbi:MAG: hypothetical protein HY746_10520 [Elusimicrobia bacterium]|nr:hypothetical protein [Elusimicrobiota bacterium]